MARLSYYCKSQVIELAQAQAELKELSVRVDKQDEALIQAKKETALLREQTTCSAERIQRTLQNVTSLFQDTVKCLEPGSHAVLPNMELLLPARNLQLDGQRNTPAIQRLYDG